MLRAVCDKCVLKNRKCIAASCSGMPDVVCSSQIIRMPGSRHGRPGSRCGGSHSRQACFASTARPPWIAQTQPPTSQQCRSVLLTVLLCAWYRFYNIRVSCTYTGAHMLVGCASKFGVIQALVEQSRRIGLILEGEGLAQRATVRSLQGHRGNILSSAAAASHSATGFSEEPAAPAEQPQRPVRQA